MAIFAICPCNREETQADFLTELGVEKNISQIPGNSKLGYENKSSVICNYTNLWQHGMYLFYLITKQKFVEDDFIYAAALQ